MNELFSIIKNLNISSLRDIGKKIGIKKYDKEENDESEKDYYYSKIVEWRKSKIKFYEKVWFKILTTFLSGLLFFIIGSFTDISNKSLKREILGNGIPFVAFSLGPPVNLVIDDFKQKFPNLIPHPLLLKRHGALIIESLHDEYPIYDVKVSVVKEYNDTGMQLAKKDFGNISEPETWIIQTSLYQDMMNSTNDILSSKFIGTHPNLAADERMKFTISTRNGIYEQYACFKLNINSLRYYWAIRTFKKEIQNGKNKFTLVFEYIHPKYPRTSNGNIIDWEWDDNMKIEKIYYNNYDSKLNLIRDF